MHLICSSVSNITNSLKCTLSQRADNLDPVTLQTLADLITSLLIWFLIYKQLSDVFSHSSFRLSLPQMSLFFGDTKRNIDDEDDDDDIESPTKKEDLSPD